MNIHFYDDSTHTLATADGAFVSVPDSVLAEAEGEAKVPSIIDAWATRLGLIQTGDQVGVFA
jgi:hypothetical protein